MIGFVKRIELHIGNATEENSMDEGNSSQDEDGSENHDENSVSFSNEE